MLSAADIAAMQALSQQLTMTTPCTIQRYTSADDGAGGQVESWADHATTVCSVAPDLTFDRENTGEGRLQLVSGWIIGLPAGTDVGEQDRIVALGSTYQVARVRSPRTIEIARDCVCWKVA